MRKLFPAVILLFASSAAHAQSWQAGPEGIAVPASVGGLDVAGADLTCLSDAYSITLRGTAVGDGAANAPVALSVDGKLFVTSATADGMIAVPDEAVGALKSGKKLKLGFSSGRQAVETVFALKGSSKALDALAANCPKTEVAGEAAPGQQAPEPVAEGAIELAASYKAGQLIEVPFTIPDKPNSFWVGSVDVGGGPTAYLGNGYAYTSSGNPVRITAPGKPGTYEIRLADDTDRRVLVAKPVTITAADPASVDSPETVQGGQFFDITHRGPDGPQNIVAIVKADDPDTSYHSYQFANVTTSPVKTRAPVTGGDYEVRYILPVGTAVVLARKSVKVTQAAEVTMTAAEAGAGAPVRVVLGADAPRVNGDYIYIARPDAAGGSYDGGYISIPADGDATLDAPAEPGAWELRYVAPDNGNWAVLGSASLTVR